MKKLTELEHILAQSPGGEDGNVALPEDVQKLLAYDRGPSFLDALAPKGSPEPGDTLGDWTLGHVLGSGGMGTVFEARRDVAGIIQRGALKTMLRRGTEAVRRFERERQMLARASGHPNLVGFLDAGIGPRGELYVVTELVAGQALLEAARDKELGLRERVKALRDLTRAAAHLHACGLIHRDIKPSNVLLDSQGSAKLLDLGIARDLMVERELTLEGELCMTPSWAAPEQLKGEEITERTDVYGLGWLGSALLGARSEQGLERVDLLAELAARRSLSIQHEDRSLEAILAKACCFEPAARYETADAMLCDLERWLAGEMVLAKKPRRYPAWGVGLVATSLLTAAGLYALAVPSTYVAVEGQGYESGDTLKALLRDVAEAGDNVQEIATTTRGEWLVITDERFVASPGFPKDAAAVARERREVHGEAIDEVAVTPSGEYIVVTDGGVWDNLKTQLRVKELRFYARGHRGKLRDLVFDPDGQGWFVAMGRQTFSSHMPMDFYAAILSSRREKVTIRSISLGRDGRWAIVADGWVRVSQTASDLKETLQTWSRLDRRVDFVDVQGGSLLVGRR